MHFILSHLEIIAPEAGMIVLFALLYAFPVSRGFAHRAIRTGKACAQDRTLPLWARYGFVVATLPIPGPFDEIAGGLIALALLRGRHAHKVRAHWVSSAQTI